MQKRQKTRVVVFGIFGIPMGFVVVVFFFGFLLGVVDFFVRFSFDPFKTEKNIKRKSTSPPFFKLEPKEEKRCLLLDFAA